MTQGVLPNAQLQEDARCLEQGRSISFYGGQLGDASCSPTAAQSSVIASTLPASAGSRWWPP